MFQKIDVSDDAKMAQQSSTQNLFSSSALGAPPKSQPSANGLFSSQPAGVLAGNPIQNSNKPQGASTGLGFTSIGGNQSNGGNSEPNKPASNFLGLPNSQGGIGSAQPQVQQNLFNSKPTGNLGGGGGLGFGSMGSGGAGFGSSAGSLGGMGGLGNLTSGLGSMGGLGGLGGLGMMAGNSGGNLFSSKATGSLGGSGGGFFPGGSIGGPIGGQGNRSGAQSASSEI